MPIFKFGLKRVVAEAIKIANHASLGSAGAAGYAIAADAGGKVPGAAIPIDVTPGGPFALSTYRLMVGLQAGTNWAETIGSTTTEGKLFPMDCLETGWSDTAPYLPTANLWTASNGTTTDTNMIVNKVAALPAAVASYSITRVMCRFPMQVSSTSGVGYGGNCTRIKFELIKISAAGTVTVLGTHDRTALNGAPYSMTNVFSSSGIVTFMTSFDVTASATIAPGERLGIRVNTWGQANTGSVTHIIGSGDMFNGQAIALMISFA